MKKIKKSKTGKYITITLVFVILFNLIVPNYTYAAGDWVGNLIELVADIVCSIGDSVINFVQGTMMPGSPKAVARRNNITDLELKEINMSRAQATITFKEHPFPMIYYSPAAIFSNRVAQLDVNILDPGSNYEKQYEFLLAYADNYGSGDEATFVKDMQDFCGLNEGEAKETFKLVNQIRELGRGASTSQRKSVLGGKIINSEGEEESNKLSNSAVIISSIASKWYIALRNICIVALLIILLYIGIRIILTSVSEELAKYKKMLQGWLIALILVFFIHYLMLVLLSSTQAIVNALAESVFDDITVTTGTGTKFAGNLTGGDKLFRAARVLESTERANLKDDENGWLDTFGYALMYLMLIMYTLIFTLKYFRRLVYMAFLTIFAPFVALTYPIDKMNDNRAQAFSYWFREYSFNLFLQPIHLILYVFLLQSALDFAQSNIIYGIIALSFLVEAEKFIRNMFGVRGEGGGFSQEAEGFSTGALFASGLRMLDRMASRENKMLTGAANDKVSAENGNEDDGNIRQQEIKDDDAVASIESFDSGAEDTEEPEEDPLLSNDDEINIEGESPTGLFGDVVYGSDQLDEFDTYEFGSNGPEDMTELGTQNPDSDELGAGTRPLIDDPTQENNPGFFGRTIRGISRATRGRFINKDNTVRLAKFATRASLGLAGAATLGTIGLAAGLASGEGLTGALKYAGLGAASGGALGLATANLGMRAITGAKTIGKRFTGDFRRGYYSPKEFRARENARIAREFLRDRESINFFKDNYGDKYKEKMQQALQLKRYGINDLNQLNKAVDIQDKYGLTEQQTATIAKLGNAISKQDLIDPEKRAEIMKMLDKQLSNAQDRVRVMSYLDQYHSIEKETGLTSQGLNDAAENIRTIEEPNINNDRQNTNTPKPKSNKKASTPEDTFDINNEQNENVDEPLQLRDGSDLENEIEGNNQEEGKVIMTYGDIKTIDINTQTQKEGINNGIDKEETDDFSIDENKEETRSNSIKENSNEEGKQKNNSEQDLKAEAERLEKEAKEIKQQIDENKKKLIEAKEEEREKYLVEEKRLEEKQKENYIKITKIKDEYNKLQ